MTLAEFFRRVKRGRTWKVTWWGAVRCADGRCPLGAADPNRSSPLPDPEATARRLGLRLADAERIVYAADSAGSPSRPWLLKRLGIKT